MESDSDHHYNHHRQKMYPQQFNGEQEGGDDHPNHKSEGEGEDEIAYLYTNNVTYSLY